MSDELPVFAPFIGIHTLKAVADALDVGWLGMGAFTKQFEDKISDYLGLEGPFVVATNTGTSALHLALLAANVGPGDEVIVPSFNFAADMQAITAVGAEPVFCDICPNTLGVDVARVAELISSLTKAIMPLHYAGLPCDLGGVYDLAHRSGMRVIEDATHAFGSTYRGALIGSFGDLTCFSFDPVKIITCIDGGAVICRTHEELTQLQHYRILGIDKDTTERYKNQRAWDYDVVSQGFRYHLSNVNASIGISQLERIDGFIKSRRETCRAYSERLADLPEIQTPQTDFADVSPFVYFIRVPSDWRAELISFLWHRGVATGIHFMPAHRYSFYRQCRRGPLPVTEQVANEIITLPLHSHMPIEKVDRVTDSIRAFVHRRVGVTV